MASVAIRDMTADDAGWAAGMGAVLLIVPAAPGSERAGAIGKRPGWSVAPDWYLGRPG